MDYRFTESSRTAKSHNGTLPPPNPYQLVLTTPHKFMKSGLGILELDAGKYMPTCSGEVPARIGQYIQDQNGVSGSVLLSDFGGPPYGYPADVVKACLVGLLRAGKMQIRPEAGAEITSVRDPGVKDMFTKEREIKRADILPPSSSDDANPRDRIVICKFFKDYLNVELDRENDAIADAVFQQFPNQVKRLQELEQKYNRLPNRPELPSVLVNLRQALEKCMRSRQIKDTVLAVKKNLDALRDGIQQLGILLADLTDSSVQAVTRAVSIRDNQVSQLKQIERLAEVSKAVAALDEQLQSERSWREINNLEPQLQLIEQHYRAVRLQLIEQQEQQAEVIRSQVKQRQGFSKVSADKAEYILRPVQKAVYDTTQDAFYPSLLQLRDSALIQLQKAEQEANTCLDHALSQETQEQVIQLFVNLKGKEVSTAEEVETLVSQLRDRLLAQLKDNIRIRLI